MPSESAVPGTSSANTPGGRRGEGCFGTIPAFTRQWRAVRYLPHQPEPDHGRKGEQAMKAIGSGELEEVAKGKVNRIRHHLGRDTKTGRYIRSPKKTVYGTKADARIPTYSRIAGFFANISLTTRAAGRGRARAGVVHAFEDVPDGVVRAALRRPITAALLRTRGTRRRARGGRGRSSRRGSTCTRARVPAGRSASRRRRSRCRGRRRRRAWRAQPWRRR